MLHLPDILIELIFIFSHFLLFVATYKVIKNDIMHPAVLFSLLWFVILLARFIFSYTLLNELFPIRISTHLIIFIGALAFSGGAFIQTAIWKKESSQKKIDEVPRDPEETLNLNLRIIFLAIIAIGLPFYILASYKLFLASNIDNFFIGLRTQLVYGDEDIGLVKYLVSFSFIVFGINLYAFFKEKNKVNTVSLIITFLITLTYVIFITGRGFFLILFSLYIGMAYLHNEKFSFKRILRFFSLFMIVFMAFGIIYGKGGNKEDTVKENIKPASQATAIYLVSAINALDWELNHQLVINHDGNNSLRLFVKLGEQLNLIPNAKVEELVQPFVFVPYPTNVYTLYSPYIKDFGIFYAWFMVVIFGFIHSWVYNKAITTKDFRYSLYYSFLLFPLLISFFMDFYLTILSSWIQIVFYTESFIFLNKRFKARRL